MMSSMSDRYVHTDDNNDDGNRSIIVILVVDGATCGSTRDSVDVSSGTIASIVCELVTR